VAVVAAIQGLAVAVDEMIETLLLLPDQAAAAGVEVFILAVAA
jgi:hypothetical protein